MRIAAVTAAVARRQASWIAGLEPWRGLGYSAAGLGRWLARRARAGLVRGAWEKGGLVGVIVTQPEVLLGHFIALVAVPPAAAGQGVGRALVEDAATRAFRKSRWLYTSSDADNRAAAGFYRKLGFTRVARLPDLVRDRRTELLWRRGPPASSGKPAPRIRSAGSGAGRKAP